jgi:Ca-activated chloride channel homolog
MGLAGLCSHFLCPIALRLSTSLFLLLIVLAPVSRSQSPNPLTAGMKDLPDQATSEVDTAHVSSPRPLDIANNAVRVDVNLVTVQVTVTDAMNRAVTRLSKDDFTLSEGDKKQEIRYFSEEDSPISVGLILDFSKSMANKIETERAAVEQFFANANSEDDYFVITVSSRPTLIANSTRSLPVIESELGLAVPEGSTALLDAIYLGVAQMRAARYKRHALLIISDGGDNSSRYKLREIKSIVRESDVAVYAIGLFDTAMFKAFEEYMGKKWLGEITDASGGRTIPIDHLSQLPEAAGTISWELRNQYVLGYMPNNLVADGRWRKIKVSVSPRGKIMPSNTPRLQAFYKRGYSASGR